jgi:hypothetical protein
MASQRKQKTETVDVQGVLREKTEKGEQVIHVLRPSCFACGKVHGHARLVRLPNGRTVGTYSDEYRVYCEAKWVFRKFRSKRTRQLYLQEVAKMRGQAGYDKLYNAMLDVWKLEKQK